MARHKYHALSPTPRLSKKETISNFHISYAWHMWDISIQNGWRIGFVTLPALHMKIITYSYNSPWVLHLMAESVKRKGRLMKTQVTLLLVHELLQHLNIVEQDFPHMISHTKHLNNWICHGQIKSELLQHYTKTTSIHAWAIASGLDKNSNQSTCQESDHHDQWQWCYYELT
jgi:hypothetical protein